jgi:hypothetical protein
MLKKKKEHTGSAFRYKMHSAMHMGMAKLNTEGHHFIRSQHWNWLPSIQLTRSLFVPPVSEIGTKVWLAQRELTTQRDNTFWSHYHWNPKKCSYFVNIKIKISCLQGPRNHMWSLLDHSHLLATSSHNPNPYQTLDCSILSNLAILSVLL